MLFIANEFSLHFPLHPTLPNSLKTQVFSSGTSPWLGKPLSHSSLHTLRQAQNLEYGRQEIQFAEWWKRGTEDSVWPLSAILPGSVKLEWWQVGIGGKYAANRGRDRLWKSHPTDICVDQHKCGKSPQEYKKEPAVVSREPHMKNTHCFWQGYDCHITHMSGIQWTCDTDIEDTLTNKAAMCTGW